MELQKPEIVKAEGIETTYFQETQLIFEQLIWLLEISENMKKMVEQDHQE